MRIAVLVFILRFTDGPRGRLHGARVRAECVAPDYKPFGISVIVLDGGVTLTILNPDRLHFAD